MCYSYIRKQAAQQEDIDRNVTTAGSSERVAPASEATAQGRDRFLEDAYSVFLADLKSLFANAARRRKEPVA